MAAGVVTSMVEVVLCAPESPLPRCGPTLATPGSLNSFAARPSPQTQVRNHWVQAALGRDLLRTHTSTFGHSQSAIATITITITTRQMMCCTCQGQS